MKPDTSTLVIPSQYTALGSEDAIQATALGQITIFTSIIPGTTDPPSIVPGTVTVPVMSANRTVDPLPTLEYLSTINGTTVAAKTRIVTTKPAAAASAKQGSGSVSRPNLVILSGVAMFGILSQTWSVLLSTHLYGRVIWGLGYRSTLCFLKNFTYWSSSPYHCNLERNLIVNMDLILDSLDWRSHGSYFCCNKKQRSYLLQFPSSLSMFVDVSPNILSGRKHWQIQP